MTAPQLGIDRHATLEVTSISWERIHVTIGLRLSSDGAAADSALGTGGAAVTFAFVSGRRVVEVPATDTGDGHFQVHVNVTNFAQRRAVPDGTWRVRASVDGLAVAVASFPGGSLGDLEDASRVFLYGAHSAALTVSYGVSESAEDPSRLEFLIHTYHLHRGGSGARGGLRGRLRGLVGKLRLRQRFVRLVYLTIVRVRGPQPGRILFASDQQATMGGNLLRVHERMIERGLDRRFDLRTSFRLPATTGWLTTVRILRLLATSEVILLDDYFGLLNTVTIDRRTRVIQLWHAGSGFKSVGYSRFGSADSPHLSQPHRQYTFAICGSEHLRPVYAEAFGIEEQAVIPTGLPRIDWFLDEERTTASVDAFYAEHPRLRGTRIVLFAPTFRGASYHSASYDYGLIDFDALAAACPPDTVVLFRMHHFVTEPVPIPDRYRDRFFDVTKYADGLGLLHVTDVLITDYSSIIYEFSLLDRPMLFFAPDRAVYAATRGFHRDYAETAPGRVCETFADLLDALTRGDFEDEKRARFRSENFDRIDTGAGDRVIDWLILRESPAQAGSPAASGTSSTTSRGD